MSKNFFAKFFAVFAIVVISAYAGYFYGTHKVEMAWSGFSPIVGVNSDLPPEAGSLDMSLFYTVLGELNRGYYDKSKIDSQKIVYGAISGALQSLGDPYTSFFPPQENENFKDQMAGEFSGIGAELGLNPENLISIIAPLEGSPAERAGIKNGDVIVKVDGKDTFGWTIAQAVEKIRGPKGTEVKLSVARKGDTEPRDLSIKRDTIQVDSVRTWVKRVSCEDGVCREVTAAECPTCSKVVYMRVSQFGDRTNTEWVESVNRLYAETKGDSNVKGIVLDLRNNPGGYMNDAVFIASEFVKSGTIVSQQDGQGNKQDFPVSRVGSFLDTPVVVLVNGGSASASEIVTGALRDYGRATVVGENTFGKGTIQRPVDYNGGESLHLTIAKWLTPKGNWVHEKGIKPDVVVVYDEEKSKGLDIDNQMSAAIMELLK